MRFHSISISASIVLLLSQLASSSPSPFPSSEYYDNNELNYNVFDKRQSVNAKLLSCLSPLGAIVLAPNTAGYQSNRYAFDLKFTFSPSVIVMASSEAHVQEAVKCAKANNVAVAPRSGGHSFEGYSIGGQDGSLVIDLAGLSSVVMVNGNQAKVGSGIRLGPLYWELFNQGGWSINAGTCPSVGIGGHALGGGFGLAARSYGLLIDRIASMEMVNADGELVTASATENPDLFFALRGAGGGSYGVVTSFTILPYQPPPLVTSFSYNWKLSDYANVLRAYVNFHSTAPREVGVELTIGPSGMEIYGIYHGPQAQLASAMTTFLLTAPAPASSDIRQSRLIDAQLRFAWVAGDPIDPSGLALNGTYMPGDSRYTKGKSLVYPKALAPSTIALLGKWAAQKPVGSTANYIIVDLWGGAIKDTASDETAFVHRDAHTVFEFVVEWDENPNALPGKPDCQGCITWINNMYSEFLKDYKTSQYGPLQSYQNYIDKDIPNWTTTYYGSSFKRLVDIKAKFDPSNVFRFPQSIPLTSSGAVVKQPITSFFSALFAAVI